LVGRRIAYASITVKFGIAAASEAAIKMAVKKTHVVEQLSSISTLQIESGLAWTRCESVLSLA